MIQGTEILNYFHLLKVLAVAASKWQCVLHNTVYVLPVTV